ncbi:hypothetical protein [Sphingomonas sp. Ag1]|jgi:putative transposase|uniref:hypothetical protein n=1 Tax=Sphingomonas sp. Ag1 TaxID=1642949 RepID=UPI000A9CED7B
MACCSSLKAARAKTGAATVVSRPTGANALEIGCNNGQKVRVAFALDCCDREAMGHVATTGDITAEDVRDLMVASVERRLVLNCSCLRQ